MPCCALAAFSSTTRSGGRTHCLSGAHWQPFCERVGGSLTRIKAGAHHTVIVDPPRGGLEPNVAPWLARLPAPRILYVSCDPATLTRDLATLTRTYDIARVKLFDLFPRTARFETLVTLERKNKA